MFVYLFREVQLIIRRQFVCFERLLFDSWDGEGLFASRGSVVTGVACCSIPNEGLLFGCLGRFS